MLGAVLAVLGISAIPLALGAVLGPRDLVLGGTLWFVQDAPQYFAAMREGASAGSWLIHDHFSAEPHAEAFMFPLYVGLGKLAAGAGWSNQAMFAAAEWIGRVLVVLSLAWFAATFLDDRRARRLAVLLALGTLGLAGWAIPWWLMQRAVGGGVSGIGVAPNVNVFLEMGSFGVLFAAPHIMFGLALTLATAPLALRAQRGGRRWTALLAACTISLALVHPFNLPVLLSVLAADGGLRARAQRSLRPLVPPALAILAALPLLAATVLPFLVDPFWARTYGAQNQMPAPPPWSLPIDYGLVLLAAPFGAIAARGWRDEQRRLLLLWVGLGLLWLYVPVPYQRRFAFGTQPALAVLAAAGLLGANAWMRERAWDGLRRRAVNYAVALAASMTLVMTYLSLIASVTTNRPVPVYSWTRAEADAASWLAGKSDERTVVLASPAFSNPLAGAIDGRVIAGHPVATLDMLGKEALVRSAFAGSVDALCRSGATIAALGPSEVELGGESLLKLPGVRTLRERDGVAWLALDRRVLCGE